MEEASENMYDIVSPIQYCKPYSILISLNLFSYVLQWLFLFSFILCHFSGQYIVIQHVSMFIQIISKNCKTSYIKSKHMPGTKTTKCRKSNLMYIVAVTTANAMTRAFQGTQTVLVALFVPRHFFGVPRAKKGSGFT